MSTVVMSHGKIRHTMQGEMVLESGGKRFRLTRNFGRQNANAKLVCLTDGEVLSVEDGDLSMLLGGVSEIVYDNTASIGQLKGRTEEGLADERGTIWQITRGAAMESSMWRRRWIC